MGLCVLDEGKRRMENLLMNLFRYEAALVVFGQFKWNMKEISLKTAHTNNKTTTASRSNLIASCTEHKVALRAY